MSGGPGSVMMFAAGFGTRMGDLTRDRPKPLIPVGGIPLIDHALALVRQAGPSRIVANLHYKADMLADHLAPLGIALSRECPEILDTGGGLRAARPLLGDGPVFTLNTDAVWSGPNPLELLRDAWDPSRMDALLMCVPTAQALGHKGDGDFAAGPDGRIRRGQGLIYAGAQITVTDDLDRFEATAFSLNLLWDLIQAKGRLFAVIYPGRWCDVGHPGGIALAETLLSGSGGDV